MNDFYGISFHISGSANQLALKLNIDLAHRFIKAFVIEILNQMGNLVVTFGDEPKNGDTALIFDYTILDAILEFYSMGSKGKKPKIQAILYNGYEERIPKDRIKLYNLLMKYDCFQIKVLPHLESHGGHLRTEISKYADILFILGGSKGVYDLIKKFQQRGKAVIPLNINLENPATYNWIELLNNGSLKLYSNSNSSYIISEINKFHLTSEKKIEESKKNILNLIPYLMEERIELILKLLLDAIISLQEKNRAIKPDEDKYTIMLVEFLRRNLKHYGYYAHTQEPSGKTLLGYNDKVKRGGMGELDIRIIDENNILKHICEAFILNHLNTSYIAIHLEKVFDYDLNGLQLNFIIIYSKANNFLTLWELYLEFLNNFEWRYKLTDKITHDLSTLYSLPAEIKLTLTNHIREGVNCKLYHILINLN